MNKKIELLHPVLRSQAQALYEEANRRLLAKNSVNAGNNQNWGFDTLPSFALNKKQVDKMYVGDRLVTAIYKGTTKIY